MHGTRCVDAITCKKKLGSLDVETLSLNTVLLFFFTSATVDQEVLLRLPALVGRLFSPGWQVCLYQQSS